MSDLRNITLNGIPLTFIVKQQITNEINDHRKSEIRAVGWHQPASGSKFRNTSHTRSGKGRIIFSAGGQQ